MDKISAFKILGLNQITEKAELKKQYRKLMRLAHPDNLGTSVGEYPYSAQEINEAYSYLCEKFDFNTHIDFESKERVNKNRRTWNAPINANAYAERQIFDDVIDSDGEKIGTIELCKGKYVWIPDEEFPLFVKSITLLSKSLLEERSVATYEASAFQTVLAELTYLLACQFIDSTKALFDLDLDIGNADSYDIFYIPAMLETDIFFSVKDKTLYPMKLKNHRLYVNDIHGNSLGYISFFDDIMSFIVTPLFESKDTQVKLSLSSKQPTKKNRFGKAYKNIDLWLKIPHTPSNTKPNDINERIKGILYNK